MTDPNPNPNPDPSPNPDPAPDPSPGPNPGGSGLDPDAMERELAEARREAARYRTERNQDREQMENFRQGIARALGIGDQGNPDPQQLQSQLQESQAQTRRMTLQNAVLTDSLSQGADPSLTWAHLFASGALDNIDIAAEDFAGQITQQVQTAMQANPKLAADYQPTTQQRPNVGGGSNPANGGGNQSPEKNPWSKEHWNLTEQGRIMMADPQLGLKLKQAADA